MSRLRRLPLRWRLVAAALLAGVGGLTVSLASGAEDEAGGARSKTADRQQAPGLQGSRVLRDSDGRIVRGGDGRPLRVAADGKTVIDAAGRPVRDENGRVIRVGPNGRVPRKLRKPRKKKRRRQEARKAPVVIGIAHPDAAQLNSAIDVFQTDGRIPDAGAAARTMGAHLNATGGIAGRRVQLRVRSIPLFDGRPVPVHEQETCDYFTRQGPKPVAVVAASGFYWNALGACLASRDVTMLTFHPSESASDRLSSSHRFAPGSLAIDRFPGPYIEALRSHGFFEGRVRVGLVRLGGYSDLDRSAHRLKTALRAAGKSLRREVVIPRLDSASELGRFTADWVGAAVRMRSAGVNRVLMIDSGGFILLFMRAAEGQGYRPRYGINTTALPLFQAAEAPQRQLRGALGIGWSPLADVTEGEEDDGSSNRKLCREIFRRAGTSVARRNRGESLPSYAMCNDLLAIRAALRGAGETSTSRLARGFESLGGSFSSPMALRTHLGPSRHDGAAGYSVLRYRESCRCFRYEGSVLGVG